MNPLLTKAQRLENLTVFFLVAAPMVVLLYGVYIFNFTHADNIVLYVMQLTADIIAIGVLMGLWLTILLDVLLPDHHRGDELIADPNFLKETHSVDVLITVAGEPVEVVEQTVKAAVAMEYPHKTFILDDGKSAEIKKVASKYRTGYITRNDRMHAKAGNVNNGLRQVESEFFVILDADQVTDKQFLNTLLPYMADPRVAMAQSPQSFENTHEFIALGSAQAQEIFYRHVLPGKNAANSVFCVGTNMVFRRSAIDEIGGIAQIGHSEDIWTSLKLHERGWKTVFVNKVLAVGNAPASISAYFKQQLRWAKGGVGMLFERNPLRNTKLTLDQRLQYFSSNIFYFIGITMIIYLTMPLAYLLFEVKPLRSFDDTSWWLHYLPFLTLYFSLSFLLIKKLHIATVATALASFYPFLLALFETLFGKSNYVWVTTTSKQSKMDLLMKWLWPHMLIIFTTFFALFIGWYEPSNVPTTFFNTLWACWNAYLLIVFIRANNRVVTNFVKEPAL
jgi:cellulose synthase (UDP-forming)